MGFSRPFVAWIVLACALATRAQAAPQVEILDTRTLGRACVRDRWAQCMVELKNSGDAAADVEVVLSVDVGLRIVHYAKRVHLPAGYIRTAWFPVRMASNEQSSVKVVDESGAQLASGQQWTNVFPWQRLLIIALDDQRLLPSLNLYVTQRNVYEREPGRGRRTSAKGDLMRAGSLVRRTGVLSVAVPDFPDHWAGLDGTGVVAVGHEDHTQWRPSQLEALRSWLSSGGVLLLFPGPDYRHLSGSPLEALLPVRIFGSHKANRLELHDGLNQWDVPLRGYVDVLESEVKDGEVVLDDGELPMVVRKRVGMGAVYFFAFPGVALNQWRGRGPLLAGILRAHERLKPFSQSELANKGPDMLDDVAGAQVAPPSFVFFSLGGFFILSAAALSLAHWRKRGELAWAVIIPVGVVIALLSYRVGVSYRKKVGLSLNEIAVLTTSSGSDRAFRSGVLGIHAERKLEGSLVAEDPNALFTLSTGRRGEGGEVSSEFIEIGPVMRLVNLRISAGAFPRYSVDSIVELEGSVVTDLQLGAEGVSGTITNNTPLELRHCMCAVNSYPYVVGDLAPGETVRRTFTDQNFKSKDDFTTEAVLGSRSRTRKLLTASLFKTGGEQAFAPWAERLFLLAWPTRDFIRERLETAAQQQVTRRSIALLCVEAPVKAAPAGSVVAIPRPFCTPALRPPHSPVTFGLSPFLTERMPPETDLILYMPRFASNVELTSAELEIAASALGTELILSGKDQAGGGLVEIARWRDLDDRKLVRIEDAGRFQNKALHALILHLKAVPAEPGVAAMEAEGWTLKDVSVGLKGVAR